MSPLDKYRIAVGVLVLLVFALVLLVANLFKALGAKDLDGKLERGRRTVSRMERRPRPWQPFAELAERAYMASASYDAVVKGLPDGREGRPNETFRDGKAVL